MMRSGIEKRCTYYMNKKNNFKIDDLNKEKEKIYSPVSSSLRKSTKLA